MLYQAERAMNLERATREPAHRIFLFPDCVDTVQHLLTSPSAALNSCSQQQFYLLLNIMMMKLLDRYYDHEFVIAL